VQVVGAMIWTTPTGALVAWALGAGAACVMAALAMPARVVGADAVRLRPAWGAEYVLASAGLQLSMALIPLVAGLEATGALRGATSLLGFTTVIAAAVHQVGLIAMSQAASHLRVRRLAVVCSAATMALILVTVGPLLFISDDVGTRLLGTTWPAASSLLPALLAQRLGFAAGFGPVLATRALDATGGVLRDRVVLGLASISASLVGGAVAGAQGAAVALAVGAWVTTMLWWRRVHLPSTRVAP
jgi:hypothetical protein